MFPPGSAHDVHRHPNAEETEYIVEGHGIARVGDDDVLVGPGDIVFAGTNEYHGFVNTSDAERAVMVWCYGRALTVTSGERWPAVGAGFRRPLPSHRHLPRRATPAVPPRPAPGAGLGKITHRPR